MNRIEASVRHLGALALGLVLLCLYGAGSALAHAVPERAIPPMDQAVPVMPSTIEVWFSEEVKPEGTKLEVLKLVAEGRSSREIAATLVISIKTVERHRANIIRKLELRDRVALTRYAIRHGLVEP